jgi:Holliday junction resolvase-like predicted endonuclease
MGNKIITEKDFWMCTMGAVPAQLQGTRLGTKKESGEVYITIEDKATSSWIDFGCKKYMLLMALAAAAAVVILAVVGVLTVATGGLALVALGAVAGLVGAAVGAVVGACLCGQKVASKRKWSDSKSNFISQGTKTITGDHFMTCAAGGTVKFAPNIKSWGDAIALGALNYAIGLAEGALGGAMIGLGGGVLSGAYSLALPTLSSIGANVVGGFTGIFGASRVLFGAGTLANDNAMGNVNSGGDALGSFTDGAIPEIGSIKRIATGQAHPADALILLYALHLKTPPPKESVPVKEETPAPKDEAAIPKEEEFVKPATEAEIKPDAKKGKGEAFEEGISTKVKGDVGEAKVVAQLKANGYTDVVQVQNKSGHGVDVIARNPATGEVKCIEVKANSSKLEGDQKLGGERYVENRLDRAIEGKGHYKIPPNPEQMKTDAVKAKEWIEDAPKVDYEVHRVNVDNATGIAGDTKVSPWDPKP